MNTAPTSRLTPETCLGAGRATSGSVSVTESGETKRISVNEPPNMHQVVANNSSDTGHVDVKLSPGLHAYSFNYG